VASDDLTHLSHLMIASDDQSSHPLQKGVASGLSPGSKSTDASARRSLQRNGHT
jgi:hypothetical protein